MRRERAVSLALFACLLAVVAVVGYLAGHNRGKAPPPEPLQQASGASASVEYPPASGWRPATHLVGIAGLAFTQPLVLAPGGEATHEGLVAGTLSGTGSSPLPAAFLAHLHGLPQTEVVALANAEAYRYSSIQTPSTTYTLYVIPSSGAIEEAVACYVPRANASEMQTCEEIASTLTVTYANGVAPISNLAPELAYARQVSAALGQVDTLRAALSSGVYAHFSAGTIATLASRLAGGLTTARASLLAVQPPAPAESAQSALLSSLSATGAAYASLAGAASGNDEGGYALARGQVAQAETGLNGVLASFALLGYK